MAHATKPCMAPDDATFAKIVADSPLVLRGSVSESHIGDKSAPQRWTDIDVHEIFRGGIHGRSLRISDWAAMDMPLFNYEPGSELIFLLKPGVENNSIILSNADWVSCVPALMPFVDNGEYAVNGQKMRLETFLRKYIREVPGLKELSTTTVAVRSGKIYVLAMMGPIRPVMHVGDPEPPDVPASGVTVEIYDKNGRKIGFAMTDSKGTVDFDLPAGTYTIQAFPRPIARATNTPITVELGPGAEERVKIDIDTGIR